MIVHKHVTIFLKLSTISQILPMTCYWYTA